MICPRCDSDDAGLLVRAPVGGVWEVYRCRTCDYTWRSTESKDIIDSTTYDARFKIDPGEIGELPVTPPIPKLAE